MARSLLKNFLADYWQALLPAVIILYLLMNYYQKGLNKIPGPWIRSISTIPRMLSVNRGSSHLEDLNLHQKYGTFVRVAPNSVSISDPAAIGEIYGIGTKFTKSPFYTLSEAHDEEGLIPDPFILTNKELHTRMKRNASNAYALNGLVQMEPWINPVTERLLSKIGASADKGLPLEMGKVISNFTMDAVFSLTFGRDFDYLNNGDTLGILKVMEIASRYMAVVSPQQHSLLPLDFWADSVAISVRSCRMAS